MMEKKAHWNIAIVGDGAETINLVELVEEKAKKDGLKVEISSAHASVHWTTPEVKK